jgi:inorganic triphosphatase YgiF
MAERAQTGPGVEREITLVICSDSRETTADRIADLAAIDGYCLIHHDAYTIRDVYFDTRDRMLSKGRWSLRIREIDEDRLITVKGPGMPVDGEGLERSELELPWSQAALKTALDSVPCLPSPYQDSGNRLAFPDPLSALAAAGFSPVQRRTTVRRPRDVRTDQGSSVVAELVVDMVRYELAPVPILHYEVEIEAKAPQPAQEMERVASALLKAYGEALLPWKLGKLATGFLMEELLAREGVGGCVRDGRLTRAAYERISAGWISALD